MVSPASTESARPIRRDLSDERLTLEAARTLFANGDDTIGVVQTVARLDAASARRLRVQCRWGEVALSEDDRLLLVTEAVPTAVNMRRVLATLHAVDEFTATAGPRTPADSTDPGDTAGADTDPRETLRARLLAAAAMPPYNVWLFALACAVGTVGLTYLNGAPDPWIPLVAAGTAAVGAFVRRGLGRVGATVLVQLFAATVLAGIVGGVVTGAGLTDTTGLAALGPLFVLVPGPALLAGLFDCAALRLPLGLARLAYGSICIVVLSAGVLIGASIAGGLTPDALAPEVVLPWWADMLAAAGASAGYAIFFTMPLRFVALPVVFGALAHGLRWVALNEWGFENPAAAGLACLFVGIVVAPATRRWGLPFAAAGFASVVAQVPGSFVFRMSGGLVQLLHPGRTASADLLSQIAVDGGTALLTLVAMGLGLVVPRAVAVQVAARRATVAAGGRH